MGCCMSGAADESKDTKDNLLSSGGQGGPHSLPHSQPESPHGPEDALHRALDTFPPAAASPVAEADLPLHSSPLTPDVLGSWGCASEMSEDGERRLYSLEVQRGTFHLKCRVSFEDEFGATETPLADDRGSWTVGSDSDGNAVLLLSGESSTKLEIRDDGLLATGDASDAYPAAGMLMMRV
ncbi:hypothetical protein AB1Y20_011170 [Prymnesium parvum]|uniref:Altered inheritance of mitochondria protein 24, mitochondrial n=1 Tax=Prymnesium parvum TaxID=97485 RepID=A0AB34IM38_PRYPA